jgi:hypothetical protein
MWRKNPKLKSRILEERSEGLQKISGWVDATSTLFLSRTN